MTVRIGINPLTWTNDDLPELGGDTPLEQCLREARQAGFGGVELGHKFPRDPAALAPLLAAHELALASGWYSAALRTRSVDDEIAALGPHLGLLKALGCSVMVFAETSGAVHGERDTPLSRRPRLGGEWAGFCAKLDAVAAFLRGEGVRLAYHHHMGTVVESEAEIDRLMRDTREVGLLLDTGHLTYAGGDPLAVARRHGERIVHVHLKDVRAPVLAASRKADRPFLTAVFEGVFTVPGDGMVDTAGVLAALAQARYDGWLVVEAEQDPAKAHPLTVAKLGYGNVARWAKETGLVGAAAPGGV